MAAFLVRVKISHSSQTMPNENTTLYENNTELHQSLIRQEISTRKSINMNITRKSLKCTTDSNKFRRLI